eukprot:10735762-Alexandrium_andersonii.AAC.1
MLAARAARARAAALALGALRSTTLEEGLSPALPTTARPPSGSRQGSRQHCAPRRPASLRPPTK